MKKYLLTLFLTVMATVVLQAQQISVVSSGGSTTLYNTLQEAIESASSGSVIYLPGGGFPISNDVKITKKLTIIGIGHYAKSENVDGFSTITGNLFFNEGSSGSAVMGCYITGKILIGEDGKSVNDILIRYCNVDAVDVKNSSCLSTTINQNYIRSHSNYGYTNVLLSNNVSNGLFYIEGGSIINNTFILDNGTNLHGVKQSLIRNNIIVKNRTGYTYDCSNNQYIGNMSRTDFGEDPIIISGDVDWNDVFKKYNNGAISPSSNFHFKDAYKQYENKVGIYAGTGFNDNQMAPVPYIVAKDIPEQTDASGKLNIKIRVKAGQ